MLPNDLNADVVRIAQGVIQKIHGQSERPEEEGGGTRYLCEDIKYDILANVSGVEGPIPCVKQVPTIRMWPEDMEIDGEKMLGKVVMGVAFTSVLTNTTLVSWMFAEPPLMAKCPENADINGRAVPKYPDGFIKSTPPAASGAIGTTPTGPTTPTAPPSQDAVSGAGEV